MIYHVQDIESYHTVRQQLPFHVIKFTAKWCGPCKRIAPLYKDLSASFTDVGFLEVDVDKAESLAESFRVRSMPTFIFVQDGMIISEVKGANPGQVTDGVEKLASKALARAKEEAKRAQLEAEALEQEETQGPAEDNEQEEDHKHDMAGDEEVSV